MEPVRARGARVAGRLLQTGIAALLAAQALVPGGTAWPATGTTQGDLGCPSTLGDQALEKQEVDSGDEDATQYTQGSRGVSCFYEQAFVSVLYFVTDGGTTGSCTGTSDVLGSEFALYDPAAARRIVVSGTVHEGDPTPFIAFGRRLLESYTPSAIECFPTPETTTPAVATTIAEGTDEAEVDVTGEAAGDEEGGDGGPSEEAILTAAGLILLLLGGGPSLLSRRRRRTPAPEYPGEALGDQLAREDITLFLRWFRGFEERNAADRDRWRHEREQRWRRQQEPSSGDPAVDAAPEQVGAFGDDFARTVEERLGEGYFVRNRNMVVKAWNNASDFVWHNPRGGQCGEFAAWGEEWVRPLARQRFGPGTIVDTLVVEEQSTLRQEGIGDWFDSWYRANHAATRVILPDGRRFIVDYWEAMGRGQGTPPRLIPEGQWTEKWKAEIGEGVVDRTEAELTLKNFVEQYGPERGVEAFRRDMVKQGQQDAGEVLLRSWGRDPW